MSGALDALIPGMPGICSVDGCATTGAAALVGSTTVSVPFMPASLWPGIEQKKLNTPALSKVNSPVAVSPGLALSEKTRIGNREVVLDHPGIRERQGDFLADRHVDAGRAELELRSGDRHIRGQISRRRRDRLRGRLGTGERGAARGAEDQWAQSDRRRDDADE